MPEVLNNFFVIGEIAFAQVSTSPSRVKNFAYNKKGKMAGKTTVDQTKSAVSETAMYCCGLTTMAITTNTKSIDSKKYKKPCFLLFWTAACLTIY